MFLLQGLKPDKELPSSFYQCLGFVHNRVEDEINIMMGFMKQIIIGSLSLKEFELKREEWKRLKTLQVQACFLTGKDSWSDFCDELLRCKPDEAYDKVKHVLSALPKLPTGQQAEEQRGWWEDFHAGRAHEVIKFWITTLKEHNKLLAGTKTTETVFFIAF